MSSHDWHPEDIKAAVRKKGVSFAGLAEMNGVLGSTFRTVLVRPSPRLELIIAQFIGHHPSTIWPSRYGRDAQPLTGRVRRKKASAPPPTPHTQKGASR